MLLLPSWKENKETRMEEKAPSAATARHSAKWPPHTAGLQPDTQIQVSIKSQDHYQKGAKELNTKIDKWQTSTWKDVNVISY